MPYKSIDNLPESIRNTLPIHAQHIFREAFNASIAKYGEVRAFKIAFYQYTHSIFLEKPLMLVLLNTASKSF